MTGEGPEPTGSGASTVDPPDGEVYETGGARALAGRTSWAIVAELANLLAVALVFKVLSDQLSTADYGALGAILAVALIAGPLATFGANWMLIRRAVVSTDVRNDVGRAIAISGIGTVGTAIALSVVFVALPSFLGDISRVTIVLVLLAQMPLYWMLELASTAAVALADLKLSAQMRVVGAVIRLWALVAFLLVDGSSVDTWAWYFAGGNAVAAVAAHAQLAHALGGPPRPHRPGVGEFVTGFPYGAGNTTEGFLAASDKPLLSQSGYRGEDGIYAAGYRIVSLGFVPLMALLRAQDRRFFRQGAVGSAASHQAGTKMSLLGLVATVPVSVALWIGAPYLDLVINDAFEEAELVIRFLALLPIVKGFQFAYGNALTAAGNQQARLWLTGAAALGNFAGNLWLIPTHGWRGAATTTLVAEIALALGFVVASMLHARSGDGES